MAEKKHSKFEEYYRKLNPEQKKAVDEIEGPVMVIAGPGTGKTQILTLRIANILKKTDTAPENILALTFTNSGVHSMRKRLVEIVGSAGYRVSINTFHGFCNDTIKTFPEHFPRIIGGRHIGKVEQIKIVEKILLEAKLKELKSFNNPFYYLDSIIREIERLKRENISVEDMEVVVDGERIDFDKKRESDELSEKEKIEIEKSLKRNEELLFIYKQYEDNLRKDKFYDYGDMVMEVIKTMEKDRDLLVRLQEEYQYVLADEHQDANQSQNKLLELLSNFHDNPNLFIVGDEKQAIFQFQGASLDNFLHFKKLYPSATIIKLVSNYRSSQSILDSAHNLISNSKLLSDNSIVPLQSMSGELNKNINVFSFNRASYQYRFVAEKIKDLIKSGVKPEEIAILYRDNRDADKIFSYLEREAIPFNIYSETSILNDGDIQNITTLVKAIKNFGEEYLLGRVLLIDFLKIDPLDVFRISRLARSKREYTLLSVLKDKKLLKNSGIEDKNLLGLYEKLSNLKRYAENKSLPEFFEYLLEETGLIKDILKSKDSYARMEKVRAFFDEIKQMSFEHRATLDDLYSYLDILERYNVSIKEKMNFLADGVWLMTAHRSKGMEFNYVFVTDVFDGHWGNKRDRRTFRLPERIGLQGGKDTLEDDRRLFYVALTRAKKEVFITYSNTNKEGRLKLPSQFIGEIDDSLVTTHDIKKTEEGFMKDPYSDFRPREKRQSYILDKKYLNALFLESGLSATSLNNFLECPWKYFFNNLILLPEAQNKTLLFGQAIHNTLKDFFDRYKKFEDLNKEDLINIFDFYLKKQPMSLVDYEEALEKGKKALYGYYDSYKDTWPRNILNEFNIKGIIFYKDIPIKGRLDKLEILDSGRVCVVDYKTGKPKSRNEIEGKTKTSNGNIKRQLVFYKILLDKYSDGKYDMKTGVIDFIEPNDRSKYKKELFEIAELEVKDLSEIIKKTIDKILSLSFVNERCSKYKNNRDKCNFCDMADNLLLSGIHKSKSVINSTKHNKRKANKKTGKTKKM